MTSHAGHTISYDSLGNPTNWYTGTKSLSNMTWEGRRLSGLTVSSTAYNYSYNSDGIRIKKQNGSNVIEYLYDDSGNLVEEKHATYSIYFIYDDSGELIGFKVSEGGTYYYGKDVFGVIKYIYNSSGTIVGSYTYDAWGNTISYTCTSETFVNPIRYKDYYYDIETGLYYLQSRYYDPQVGRFISADDTGYLGATGELLGYNLYMYCENDPVKNYDPFGLWVCSIGVEGQAAFVLGVYAGFAVNIDNNWNISVTYSVGFAIITNAAAYVQAYIAIYKGKSSVYQLNGWGISIGASISLGAHISFGGSIDLGFDSSSGGTVSLGGGIGASIAEIPYFQTRVGYTGTLISLNLLNVLKSWPNKTVKSFRVLSMCVQIRKYKNYIIIDIIPLKITVFINNDGKIKIYR